MAAKTKKRRRRRWIISGAILLLVLGLGSWSAAKRGEPSISVTAEEVAVRTLTSTVSAAGRIHPEVEVKISSEIAGEIIELPVVEGQRVERGDLLARIKPDTYEAQVRQREASIQAAQATSLQREAELLQVRLDLKRLEELRATDLVPQSELDQARTRVEVAAAFHQSSLFDIQQRETLLEEARENLARTRIFSPMSGTISQLTTELGERVVGTGQFAGTEMMRVANLENMELRVQVNENDVINVKVGDRSIIVVDALPDQEFLGTVKEISNAGQTSGARTQEEVTTFEVRIRIVDLDPRIRPGMSATVEIETQTVENVLSVPIQSVTVRDRREIDKTLSGDKSSTATASAATSDARTRNNGGNRGGRPGRDTLGRVVFVVDGDRVRIREVETGISDSSHIEIKSGLAEGERIVSGNYSAISRLLEHDKLISIEAVEDGPGGRPRS
ncbi:MAG: efflux RND transporter periplasmic adaptor subunit [Puniceicoccaceae bacterium]|nr:MAG: efflux RND transporter periplasmic adaptor subunit [Puniceicoccaceae bacterium]